jgi:hypothetical protein
MKYLVSFLVLGLCSACAPHKPVKSKVTGVSEKLATRHVTSKVRTSETVKAYPVGRYTDPNYPDEMHERHTLYRREVSADWNYLPDAPYALPLGPVVAHSDPSPSYYVKTDNEQMNAQQKAYAEALMEQNRALKKRIESMEQQADRVPGLEKEIDRLKSQLRSMPAPAAPPKGEGTPPSTPEPVEGFSRADPSLPEPDSLTAFSLSHAFPGRPEGLATLTSNTP